jgi:hypothetical protein
VDRHQTARQARPLYDRELPKGPRSDHQPPGAGAAGAIDARHIHLWENILALPIIGTLDSARAQNVMESLLEEIVAARAQFAIIDITGVPTVAVGTHQFGG